MISTVQSGQYKGQRVTLRGGLTKNLSSACLDQMLAEGRLTGKALARREYAIEQTRRRGLPDLYHWNG